MRNSAVIVSWGYFLCAATCGAQDLDLRGTFHIAKFQATVAGKVHDTIRRDELLNAGSISVEGYDNYRVTGFVCKITSSPLWLGDTNKQVQQFIAKSASFTYKMELAFQSIYGVAQICFTDIKCKGPDRTEVEMNDINLALSDIRKIVKDTNKGAWAKWGKWTPWHRKYKYDITVGGKAGGTIRKKEMLDAGMLQLNTQWGGQIISYKVYVKTKKGYRSKFAGDENFTASIMDLITNAVPGSTVSFRRIKYTLPDGTIATCRKRTYKLKRHWFFKKDV